MSSRSSSKARFAVVLLSGGMDSTTALGVALRRRNVEGAIALSFRYGSKHEVQELRSARLVASHFKVEHIILDLPTLLFEGSNSALFGGQEMPHVTYEQILDSVGPSPTVVPFRNGVFLAMATAVAASRGARYVFAGVHALDAHNWAYPDCTPDFLKPFADAAYAGTYHEVQCEFPFTELTKHDIVAIAARNAVPLGLTWSCYDPKPGPGMSDEVPKRVFWNHCGVCPTCIERIAAFRDSGYIDPVTYDIVIHWRGCEPWPS